MLYRNAITLLLLGALSHSVLSEEKKAPEPPNLQNRKAPFNAREAQALQKAWGKYLKIPVFSTNKIGMRMALIPPGAFTMGSHKREPERGNDETLHRVKITRAFRISTHEVTVGQFRQFVQETGYQTEAEREKKKTTWRNAFPKQRDNWPVVVVTWNDAMRFCRWLSKKEGQNYQLPSEAQWECACRAGTGTAFHYGNTLTSDQANFNGQFPHPYGQGKRGPNRKQPTPVGSFKPNAFGLFDMHGNVWEYCLNLYGPIPRKLAVDPFGAENGLYRVVRGGCFSAFGRNCRSADRESIEVTDRSTRTGFRVVAIRRGR